MTTDKSTNDIYDKFLDALSERKIALLEKPSEELLNLKNQRLLK